MKVEIRKITPEDSGHIKRIIQTVMPEFGANGPGFAIHDAEVNDMFEAYQKPRSSYFVVDVNGQIIGGAGVAPLEGGPEDVCELKKMYFLPSARGKGYGKLILQTCLREARALGFRQCYLETFNTMTSAIKMYEQNGFQKIPHSMGATGHFGCDTFYALDL